MDEKLKLSIELLSSILKNSQFDLAYVNEENNNQSNYDDIIINIRDVYFTEIKNKNITIMELLKLIYKDIDSFENWHKELLKNQVETKQSCGKLKDYLNK